MVTKPKQGPLSDETEEPITLGTESLTSDLPGISGEGHKIIKRLPPGQTIPPHSFAARFRRSKEHRDKMRRDLKINGQQRPGLVLVQENGEEVILDGVTRLEELHGLGHDWLYETITSAELPEGRAVEEHILRLNLGAGAVRQMNDSERAIYAARLREKIEAAADERKRNGKKVLDDERGTVAEKLADIANVKPDRIEQAMKVLKSVLADELEQLVFAGVPISLAAKAADHYRLVADEALKEAVNQALSTALMSDGRNKQKSPVYLLRHALNGHAKDRHGNSIPDGLKPVFDCEPQLTKTAKLLGNTANWIRTLQAELQVAVDVDVSRLDRMADELLNARPLAVCHCDGNNSACPRCEGRGFILR